MCLTYQKIIYNGSKLIGPFYKVVFVGPKGGLISPWAGTYLRTDRLMIAKNNPQPENKTVLKWFSTGLGGVTYGKLYGFTAFADYNSAQGMIKVIEKGIQRRKETLNMIPKIIEVYMSGEIVTGLSFSSFESLIADKMIIFDKKQPKNIFDIKKIKAMSQ